MDEGPEEATAVARPPRYSVVTLFPDLIRSYVAEGIVGRAVKRGLAVVDTVDPRDHTTDRYRSVDDVPFGGGAGMVMKPGPVARAIESAGPVARRVLVTPSGRLFTQADALAFSRLDSLVLVCGRYEGIDQRVCDTLIDDEISIGDYVLSGGELAALVVIDATLRLLPGVLGNAESAQHESFSDGLLEHPHYTRPATWRDLPVPPVLLSGHHARIEAWRRQASLRRTARVRPDLLASAPLTDAERQDLLDGMSSHEETD